MIRGYAESATATLANVGDILTGARVPPFGNVPFTPTHLQLHAPNSVDGLTAYGRIKTDIEGLSYLNGQLIGGQRSSHFVPLFGRFHTRSGNSLQVECLVAASQFSIGLHGYYNDDPDFWLEPRPGGMHYVASTQDSPVAIPTTGTRLLSVTIPDVDPGIVFTHGLFMPQTLGTHVTTFRFSGSGFGLFKPFDMVNSRFIPLNAYVRRGDSFIVDANTSAGTRNTSFALFGHQPIGYDHA